MKPTGVSSRPDFATILGLLLAVGGILGGLVLEKGSVRDVAQFTAALVVLGGTFGALLVNTPFSNVMSALGQLKAVFFERSSGVSQTIDEIITYATKARKLGVVSLENDAASIADPFLKKAVNLAIDGTDLEELRSMMELEIDLTANQKEEAAKVFDSAGGYAPTIGIIGAVMGLIQVMKNLADIQEVGHGIAVAFVATIYGVALANIFLLPAAGKIRLRAAKQKQLCELMLTGVLGIIEGANPKLIRGKLEAYTNGASTGSGVSRNRESSKAA